MDPDSAVWGHRATLAVSARPAVGLDCRRHAAAGALRQRLRHSVVGRRGFGGRRFVSYLPFLVLGLSAFLASRPMASRPALVRLASLFLIGTNLLFLLQYQLFMRGFTDIVPVYPDDLWTVFAERFVVPFKLLAAWMST